MINNERLLNRRSASDEGGLPDAADGARRSARGGSSRRDFLKTAGLAALGVGVVTALGAPHVARLARTVPARSVMPVAGALRVDHVTVVDPRDGSRRSDMSVLVRGGRIESVEASSSTRGSAGLRVIDGADRFVVPGYNNMHTHVLQAERSSLFMATMLREGTTGMRQMAGTEELLRQRRENRLPLGASTPGLLAMPGSIIMPFVAPTVSRVRAEISRQKDLGADFIKLVMVEREVFFEAVSWAHRSGLAIGGHLPPSVSPSEASDAGYDFFEHLGTSDNIWLETSSESAALRSEQGTSMAVPNWLGSVPFAGQIFESDVVADATARTLLNPALLDSTEFVALLSRALDTFDGAAAQRLVTTFASNTTWQTPTLSRLSTEYRADLPEYEDHPWLRMLSLRERTRYQGARSTFLELPATTRSTYHRYYDMSAALVKRMHDAGVPVMTGTDGPSGNPGQDMQSEFRELALAGLSPLDILRATTTVPAAFLGRSDRMGAVAEGMDADFLLLDADPLAHVENLGQISAVVRAGHHWTIQELDETVDRLLASAEAS